MSFSSQDDGGRAIGEEACSYQVALGAIALEEGEAAQLDADQEYQLVRVGSRVLRRPGEAGGPPGAAEAPKRYAPHVLGEAKPEDQLRVQGGRGDARGRDEEDGPYVLGASAGLIQCSRRGFVREV